MPEWLNGTVSKTVWRFMCHEGSNPSLSAFARRIVREGGLLFWAPADEVRCCKLLVGSSEIDLHCKFGLG
jgi:hypothetical protein